MKSALVIDNRSLGSAALGDDLAAVGIQVLGAANRSNLVREAVRLAPDFIVCHDEAPDDGLFTACRQLAETAPRPVIVFTRDADASKIEQAMQAGVHAYVVNGYALNRLRSVIHVAEARFSQERQLRDALADVTRRFDERKLVDRAKGILMRARQVTEEEAFRVLRSASMISQRRVGQVSKQVIDAAHFAEAVNRAGKLRMLSQRLIKLCALRWVEGLQAQRSAQLTESVKAVDDIIGALDKSLSKASFGDLLEAVAAAWQKLSALVALLSLPSATTEQLAEADVLAEALLAHADQLTRQLEMDGLVTTLHIINMSGRQRMLSQRYAKQALLGVLLGGQLGALQSGDAARLAMADVQRTAAEFEQALAYLKSVPLSSREIRELLAEADRAWGEITRAYAQARSAAGQQRMLGEASEALLAVFDALTSHYERSMQVLMG